MVKMAVGGALWHSTAWRSERKLSGEGSPLMHVLLSLRGRGVTLSAVRSKRW